MEFKTFFLDILIILVWKAEFSDGGVPFHEKAAVPSPCAYPLRQKTSLLVSTDRACIVRMRVGAYRRDATGQERIDTGSYKRRSMPATDHIGFADELINPA